MAAESACTLSEKDCGVVPTKSVPQAFAALFAVDEDASLEENVAAMAEAAQEVKTGEVTIAIKDSKDSLGNPIHSGDVIGIAGGSIDAVAQDVNSAVMQLLGKMDAADADIMTILAGQDLSDAQLEQLEAAIQDAYPDLEMDIQDGGQPLYPVVFSLE